MLKILSKRDDGRSTLEHLRIQGLDIIRQFSTAAADGISFSESACGGCILRNNAHTAFAYVFHSRRARNVPAICFFNMLHFNDKMTPGRSNVLDCAHYWARRLKIPGLGAQCRACPKAVRPPWPVLAKPA
jgi:hypothetical protein